MICRRCSISLFLSILFGYILAYMYRKELRMGKFANATKSDNDWSKILEEAGKDEI